ncbi:MAG: cyclodeaminase/cyclohydrolase family protein [Oscillospiraceae bacterium]|nr:cyclodeaminase/cyclohydrolase family protein [Oscillospiraceae bacterium]
MKLSEMTVSDFSGLLASDAPAPGGGSAAALSGALGAALTAMVACLTRSKKKYAEFAPFAAEVEEKEQALRAKLLDVMDRDTEAFLRVSAAFALPKETPEDKAARSAAIQLALKGCTETPMEMMQLCSEALQLTEDLLERGFNDSASSDLGAAALSLKAGIQGAWLNVLINIGSIRDEAFVSACRAEGEALLARALPLADRIYSKVLTLIEG